MIKKIVIFICCIIIALLYSIGDFSSVKKLSVKDFKQYFTKTKILPDFPKGTIHIYTDDATFPTELQLFDMIQRPADTPKIISWNWNRFPNLNLDPYNATKLDFSFFRRLTNYDKRKIDNFIEELKNLENNDFVIHANLLGIASVIPLLKELPKEKIKHIYLYEDGLANHLASTTSIPAAQVNNLGEQDLTKIFLNADKFSSKYAYFLHKYYPVTYRITYWNEFKKRPLLGNFLELMKDADVENVNLQEIANTLTDEQKKELFNIFNFDVDFYKKMIANKKVHFFVVGHYLTYNNEDLQEWFDQHNSTDDILFIKGSNNMLANRLIPAFTFPNQLPFEMLVIGDLIPTSVSGVSSSLFYALPKENIGKIIYEPGNPNAETIRKLKDLTDTQIKFSDIEYFEKVEDGKEQ